MAEALKNQLGPDVPHGEGRAPGLWRCCFCAMANACLTALLEKRKPHFSTA